MNLNKLEKLIELKERGAITEEEFLQEKERLKSLLPNDVEYNGISEPDRTYLMILHLSQLTGLVLPFFGLIIPLVMWLAKKDESPIVDKHGVMIMNWQLSSLLYLFASIILAFIIVGFVTGVIIYFLMIILPILGGIKANKGEFYKYPLSISFLKID